MEREAKTGDVGMSQKLESWSVVLTRMDPVNVGL
jgi:hypothetical protein